MKRKALSTLAAAALALVTSWATAEPDSKLTLGDPAPPLDITFLKNGPVSLDEGKGEKVYIVEFWATWCPPCKESIPHLTKLQKQYKKKGLEVIGISPEDKAVANLFVKDMGRKMGYAVAVDNERKTINAYMEPFGLTGIPVAFLVDKNGRLAWYGNPLNPDMEQTVKRLLAEQPKTDKDT